MAEVRANGIALNWRIERTRIDAGGLQLASWQPSVKQTSERLCCGACIMAASKSTTYGDGKTPLRQRVTKKDHAMIAAMLCILSDYLQLPPPPPNEITQAMSQSADLSTSCVATAALISSVGALMLNPFSVKPISCAKVECGTHEALCLAFTSSIILSTCSRDKPLVSGTRK